MAADNSWNALTKLIDITECCICLQTFSDPRILPCIHTFCLHCLQDMVAKADKKPGDCVQCSVCRKEFTIPVEGIEDVQKNFFMTSLIEVRIALNQAQIETPLCDICKENNEKMAGEISEATVRCLVCMENLCNGCLQQHNTFKLMRNHEILNIGNNVQTNEKHIVKNFKEMNCDNHRGKVLDYYCAECKKVVCVSCFVESHRTHDCKDVTTVEKEFRQIIKNNADRILTLVDELLAKKERSKSKENFLKQIAAREKEVLQRSEELKRMIDEETNSLLTSLDEIKNRHLKEIQNENEELETRRTILDSFSRYCDELGRKGSASEICRSKDELLRRADELEEDHEKYIMLPRVSFDVTFQATGLDKIYEAINGNIVGNVKESVEQFEDFAVAFGATEDSDEMNALKIRLRGQGEMASTFQTLPTGAECFPVTAVYGDNLFLIGFGKLFDEMWRYSFTSGWKKCGSLVQGRGGSCAEFIDETLYICGGSNEINNIVIGSIEAYNALTEKITLVGQLRVGSIGSASVAYKDLIYVFGGLDKDSKSLDCVQMFSPVDNTCTLLSISMPRPVGWLRAVVWKTYAILQGIDTCFVFDFEAKTWQERQQFVPNEELFCFGMVLENERIFIIGGMSVETDARGNEESKYKDDVKYIRALSIVNNYAAKWRTCCQLLKPFSIITSAKLSLSS